jgi:hypothetical protein
MSFRLFIYYCAVCGGWGALAAWVLVEALNLRGRSVLAASIWISGLVGLVLAGAVGTLDALLNAVGQQRWLRVVVCLAVGFLGGLIGGALGQVLQNRGLPRFLGWTMVGMAIGASIGVFDVGRALRLKQTPRPALRKLLNGLTGGVFGGLVGGLLFDALETFLKLPRSSLALGLVILGTSIGLLVGLAQIVLKEAWIKIEKGFRAGREMMLSKAETTIGRAESCDIGLFGDNSIERTHARIVLKGNRYLLADALSPGGTFLNDQPVTQLAPLQSGDVIRIGNSLLRFGEKRKRPN